MARNPGGRESKSGLSSMLIYYATIIIHDLFRTNNADKNISDRSSYLDLCPLHGYTKEMQRKVRDDKYKLGLLKPDTFAEDRLLRQPPGVCIMLVMYNRYHNYAATQLRRINENGRFSVPLKYAEAKLVVVAEQCIPAFQEVGSDLQAYLGKYKTAWRNYRQGSSEEILGGYSENDLERSIPPLRMIKHERRLKVSRKNGRLPGISWMTISSIRPDCEHIRLEPIFAPRARQLMNSNPGSPVECT